ncbi:hypothetical protein HMPREF1486_04310, partial [Streptomyces sp. HPH0547]
ASGGTDRDGWGDPRPAGRSVTAGLTTLDGTFRDGRDGPRPDGRDRDRD